MADARLARAGAHAMGPRRWSISGWLELMRSSSRAGPWPSKDRFRYRIVPSRSSGSRMRPSGGSRFWVGCSLRIGRRMIPAMAGCLLASVSVARAATWSVAPVPAPTGPASSLSAVSCTSARACIAVGSGVAGPLAERWNGERWALQKTPKLALGDEPEVRALSAVSCSSAGACTAVGTGASYAPLIERWNGRRWSLQKLSANSFPSELTSVACAAATSCVAAGDAGLER